MTNKQLKPCPFCGRSVRINYNGALEPDGIWCDGCKMIVRYSRIKNGRKEAFEATIDKLTEAWNRRTE